MDPAKNTYWSYMCMVHTSSHPLDKSSLKLGFGIPVPIFSCVDSEYSHVKILNNHLSVPAKEYSY